MGTPAKKASTTALEVAPKQPNKETTQKKEEHRPQEPSVSQQIVRDIASVVPQEVKASSKGHPLGNNRALHLPPHLTVAIEDLDLQCEASRYTVCNARCILCKGQ